MCLPYFMTGALLELGILKGTVAIVIGKCSCTISSSLSLSKLTWNN